MDRTREARRGTMATVSGTHGGLSRRRHRSNSLRDSPEDDGPVELQETTRLRDRKKDRDRERERERERSSRTSKRRRGDRLVSNREDGADESSEESVDDEDDDDEDGSVRMIPPNNNVTAGSLSIHHQQQHHQQNQHRKSFPVPVKVIRTTTPPSVPPITTTTTTNTSTWKPADEMIGVSVPRKARSASTKRSHEWASSGAAVVSGVAGEHIYRQASTSPVRRSPAPVPAPASPSSSNASMRKKMKPNGPKQRPPKASSKSSSSAPDEIEMEIAEVLYGLMRQPQVPSKQDVNGNDSVKLDSREVNNKHSNDSKSRVSSPISHSPSILPQPSSILPSNSTSSATPMSTIAPKRKRPRLVKYEDETTTITPPPSIFPSMNNSVSLTTTKVEIDQSAKIEVTNTGSVAENGGTSYLMNSSQAVPASSDLDKAEPMKEEKEKSNLVQDSKPLTEESGSTDISACKKEESQSSMKETSPSPAYNPPSTGLRLGDDRGNSTVCEIECQREDKLQIDLMSMPPSRSSPERDDDIDFGASHPKPVVTNMELEIKSSVKEDDKRVKFVKEDANVEADDNKKPKPIVEEAETHNPVLNSERNINLQLDLEKSDRNSGTGSVSANKFNHHVQKQQQQQQQQQHQHPDIEKSAQSGALPLPMSLASWPGGLPPMGCMAPLQGVVSMDGSAVSSAPIQPPHLLFNQPRPKRCATHCYIARNVHYHQQFMKMNPFWPAGPGSASLYGPKTNLSIVPPAELNGNISGKAVNSVQDKGQGLATFTGHVGKDKSSQAASNMVDAAQRKQIMFQQALPPGANSNIMHGPAFIFPLSQQQQAAAAAASVRPGSVKSPGASSTTLTTSNSASVSATPAGANAPPGMSFNYGNMPGNETQYVAILQNNAYPFPFPAHVGAPPGYRGNHGQPMPFIPGSFYSSQMLQTSQLQQQQQQQPPTQLQQSQQGHQNTSISSGGSSSQKQLQNLQQRPHGSGVGSGSGSGNLQGFPAPKNQSPHPMQLQQRQQQPSQHASHQPRHLDGELGGKDSPSTADSRVSRANMNIYGQNFAMPPNFTLMTAASMGGSTSSGGNHGEKKQHNQQSGSKGGAEPHTSQSFAMSFASMNGTTPTLDMSSFARDHAILQSLPESTRQGYQQMMAAAVAAQTAQQKKNNYHASEEGNHRTNEASSMEEGRNAMAGKISAGQSIAFSRPDLSDSSASTIPGSNVIDSSARNLGSTPSRNSGSVMPASMGGVNSPSAQQQLQRNQQQQHQHQHQHHQQMLQLQKSHQFGTASRSKMPVTSNGSAYSDHLPSSSIAAKFPNAMSAFPQNMAQTSSNPGQSPQWKNSARTHSSQVSSPSLSSSTSSTLKNISQQQARPQQSHTEISFAANPKTTLSQQPPSSTASPSPPMMVGSPTTSVSRSAGSPRTTGSTSTGNKGGQASSLSSQQTKNSPSGPSQMSSPVGGRNVPSVLGNSHLSSSNMGTKPQMVLQQQQQQQQQQQHQKHAMHPAQQLFFSPAYMQAQAQHSPNSAAASGYFLQRHRNEQQQQQSQPQGSSTTSTSMLSLCSPVSLANTGTTDPAKAAAHAGNIKGQGHIHAAQFANTQSSGKPYQLVPGFPYVHAVPAGVQVKPTEQKQPAAGE